jgi:hypothetical protein
MKRLWFGLAIKDETNSLLLESFCEMSKDLPGRVEVYNLLHD